MSTFVSSEQAQSVFTELFTILLDDDAFRSTLQKSQLSLHLIQHHPDVELFVTADGVRPGSPASPAAIRMKMSCDTAHALWKGNLLMPLAVATGRVRIKGSISKVLEFVPRLQPAFDRYSEVAASHGVSA
jgi:hypothetical protein